jgi:hypothetical protein
MGLRDTIKAATKVVPSILDQMAGSTVTTTRYVKTRDAAQRVVNTPTHPITGGDWYIREISTAHAQRVWGLQSAATAEAALPLGTDVADGDVVVITAGDFAGNKYEIEGGGTRHDPLGNRVLVALIPTGKTGS